MFGIFSGILFVPEDAMRIPDELQWKSMAGGVHAFRYDILGCERRPTRHYSTVSRNNPPIYPRPGVRAAARSVWQRCSRGCALARGGGRRRGGFLDGRISLGFDETPSARKPANPTG